MNTEYACIEAPPARFERATFGLGMRSTIKRYQRFTCCFEQRLTNADIGPTKSMSNPAMTNAYGVVGEFGKGER